MIVDGHNESVVAAREQTANGVIVSHEPQNHNRYGYKFQVDGGDYTGWETPFKEDPRSDSTSKSILTQ